MEFKGLGPDAWGKVAVTEIADDTGAILTIDKPDAASLTPNALDRPRERGAGGLSGDLDRHMLEIRFRSPALQARRLSSVKGCIGFLHYVAQKAAKIDNAILPEMIGAPDDVAYGNRDAKRFSPLLSKRVESIWSSNEWSEWTSCWPLYSPSKARPPPFRRYRPSTAGGGPGRGSAVSTTGSGTEGS